MSDLSSDAALLELWGGERDDPQRVQRRLARGLCARCGHPVPTKGKGHRRSPMCDTCWTTHGWCSRGQHARPRGEFARLASSPRGIGYECAGCRRARSVRKAAPLCGRCGERPVVVVGTGRRKLCAACLATHAWCNRCGPRPRRTFDRAVVRGEKHAGTCRRCDRVPAKNNRLRAYRQERSAIRVAAIADAVANPDETLAAIAARHGISETTLSKALAAAGQPRRPGDHKRRYAHGRHALARELRAPALAQALGISLAAARSLRARARASARKEAA